MRALGIGLIVLGLPASVLLPLIMVSVWLAWGRPAYFNAFDLAFAGVSLASLLGGVTVILSRPR